MRYFYFFIIILFSVASLLMSSDLRYKPRGDRYEGIKRREISAIGIENISALIYRDSTPLDGDYYKLTFFLPKDHNVGDLVIREIKPRYIYWLDKVKPHRHWRENRCNTYKWSKKVLTALKLTEKNLGGVVKIHSRSSYNDTAIAPAILYSGTPHKIKDLQYHFRFRLAKNAEIRYSIYSQADKNKLILRHDLGIKKAKFPLLVSVNTKDLPGEGWYSLLIDGSQQKDGSQVRFSAKFYHKPNFINGTCNEI